MILLVFMRVLLYNKDMDTNNYKPIFNDEQLNKMSKENLTEVILLMQKQQSKLEEKISGLQKKQQVLEEKNKELEFINATQKTQAPISMLLGTVRIEISSHCPQNLLQSLIEVLKHYA